jgi:hypothetical protein
MAVTDIHHITGNLAPSRYALAFLGGNVDDYIQVDAAIAARVTANDTVGTFSAWIMIRDITTTGTIIGCGDKNAVEFLELNVEAGLLTARATDATVAQFVTQADAIGLTRHKWHHVAMVQPNNGHGVKLYIDGKQIAATHDTSTDVDSWIDELDGLDSMRIGAANKAGDDSVTQEFTGGIGTVKYWNKALTDDEVKDDFEGRALSDDSTYLQNSWEWNDDLTDSGLGNDPGTKVGDIVLSQGYCEFESKFRSAGLVTADYPVIAIDRGAAHCIVIKAA